MSAPAPSAVEPRVQPPSLTLLLGLAWPIVLSRMSQTVIGLSDALLVARLGGSALAATATGALNTYTVMIPPMGVQYVVSSFVAQLHGAGDAKGGLRYAWYGLVVSALTLVVSLGLVPVAPWALSKLAYEPEVLTLMSTYVSIRLLSAGPAIGVEGLSSYYGGRGKTRPGMVANVVAMVLNVFLNWVLIEGHLGAPALGVAGSALASTLATWTAFLGFFAFFWLESGGRPEGLRWAELGRLFRFGLPEGLNYFFEFLAFVFFVDVVVSSLGTPALAGTNAVFNVNSVSFMPAFGIASAGAILVGQALGAKQPDDVPKAVRLSLAACLTWQTTVGLLSALFARPLMSLFARGADAEAVLDAAVQVLVLSVVWNVFDACANALAEALRASGDTLFPMLGRLVIAWACFAPGAYFSVHHLGWKTQGAALWLIVYLALLAGLLAWRYRQGAWRRIRLVAPMGEQPSAAS